MTPKQHIDAARKKAGQAWKESEAEIKAEGPGLNRSMTCPECKAVVETKRVHATGITHVLLHDIPGTETQCRLISIGPNGSRALRPAPSETLAKKNVTIVCPTCDEDVQGLATEGRGILLLEHDGADGYVCPASDKYTDGIQLFDTKPEQPVDVVTSAAPAAAPAQDGRPYTCPLCDKPALAKPYGPHGQEYLTHVSPDDAGCEAEDQDLGDIARHADMERQLATAEGEIRRIQWGTTPPADADDDGQEDPTNDDAPLATFEMRRADDEGRISFNGQWYRLPKAMRDLGPVFEVQADPDCDGGLLVIDHATGRKGGAAPCPAPKLDPHTARRDPTPEEPATLLPTELIPAPPAQTPSGPDNDPQGAQERRAVIKNLEHLDLGFQMSPYDPKGTAIAVREAHAGMLREWLKLGAYLYRAKLMMQGEFWAWFEKQGFPFKRRWAEESINTTRLVLNDPAVRGIAKRLGSIKHFQVVTKRLGTPDGRQEWETQGTVYGRTPEDIDGLSQREVVALGKNGSSDTSPAQLPLGLDELTGRLAKAEKEKAQAEATLAATRAELAKLQNPHLNQSELEKAALAEAADARAQAMLGLYRLRTKGRRDLVCLERRGVLEWYSNLLLIEKEVHGTLREVEEQWGGQYPEILCDLDGNPRSPLPRGGIRLIRRVQDEHREGIDALRKGEPVDLVDGDGVIVHEEG